METVIYIVKQGDSLCDIAKKYNTTANMIARYNGLADTDILEMDEILRIPVSTIPNMGTSMEYTIQSGDTLSKIAEKYGTTVEALAKLNGIADADEIWAGNVIKIPLYASTLPMPTPEIHQDDKMIKYIVQEGDTLWKISKRFNVKLADIINLNKLTNPDLIYPDQVIIIPE